MSHTLPAFKRKISKEKKDREEERLFVYFNDLKKMARLKAKVLTRSK